MQKSTRIIILVIVMTGLSSLYSSAQLSPGDLSSLHTNLEGMSNCTQCHELGKKVSDEKCLLCHTEVKDRIALRKGYHVSSDVNGKSCIVCHSEHHGKNFQLIRFDAGTFDHNLTGYKLSGPHAKKECKDCHDKKYISDQKIKTKKYTFMGVETACLNCHDDYHQKTLSSDCLKCHNPDSFKPASAFNHNDARFKLAGKHNSVDCIKCHLVEYSGGRKNQTFRGMQFSNCTDCHKDPHKNKYGQDCRQCHNEESFQVVKGVKNFDHNKTNFKLEGKHENVSCVVCHKTKFTDPLRHKLCSDCHTDYHKKQFVKNGVAPDCIQCHTVKGFSQFTFTLEQHNNSSFALKDSHIAVPCFECHKKQKEFL